MARKGNQQKNGAVRHTSNHKKRGSESDNASQDAKVKGKANEVKICSGEELPNSMHPDTSSRKSFIGTHQAAGGNQFIESPGLSPGKGKYGMDEMDSVSVSHPIWSGNGPEDHIQETSSIEDASEGFIEKKTPPGHSHCPKHIRGLMHYLTSCFSLENVKKADHAMVRKMREFSISTFELVSAWLERQRPQFMSLKTKIYSARDHIKLKLEQAYPIILKLLMHFGNIMLVLTMVWLDCTIRGIDSFVRMGTASLFSVFWCSIFSVISMVGMFKFLIVMVASAIVAVFVGFALAVLLVAISGAAFLWFYGSFWMTLFVIFLGGLAFTLSHERIALLITTLYSVYCVWVYVGWMGLLLALNLSFISSDVLMYHLKNNVSSRGPDAQQEQTNAMHGESGFFYSDTTHASFSESGPGLSADRGPGIPSTSGVDTEITAENEVLRLLNCTDHYSALGLSRYQDVDITLLKKEYKKKAMLVHPDKNMGNEKAAEAFKKLQNAYEVLLDSLKRKAYDDELRREELLSYFRRFQNTSEKNGGHGFFASGFARSEADGDDPFGDSRRIACKRCGNFHVWVQTKKSKSRARWCQECKEFHQAKDGDGWVEQSSQPFFFGLLQKVDAPFAYVCADSKIYNATDWYICQGMKCPPNTHKPSFHVNTSVTSKHGSGKGSSSSGQRGGQMPPPNLEETMTEEEFFEWLQNAVQAGVFENFGSGMSSESAKSRAGSGSGSGSKTAAGSNSSGGGSGNKRRKKGKKQW